MSGEADPIALVRLVRYATTRSVVFHDGGPTPPPDAARAIDYVATTLSDVHVSASAAIPAIFPAVRVAPPARERPRRRSVTARAAAVTGQRWNH